MQTTPEMSVPALVMNCLAPSITHSPSSQARARARVAGVRAGLGLGQPERAEPLARAQPRQPLALLLLGAEQVDRLRAERGVRAQRDRHRGVHARELLDRERVGERVAAAAAVLLGERDAHQVQLAELARRSRRGTTSCGRAPRRPARPRPRRTRARCGGSARGRGRGRSPSRAAFSQRRAALAMAAREPRSPDPRLPARAGARHRYGADRSQRADLYLPRGAGPHPVMVLIHGGSWQQALRQAS